MKSRIRCLAALLLCAALVGGAGAVRAVEREQLFYEAGLYTGTLYFCDSVRETVVLTDVMPAAAEPTAAAQATAAAAEYEELLLAPFGLRLQDGTPLTAADLNAYADSRVQAVLVRCEAGLRVLSLRFV